MGTVGNPYSGDFWASISCHTYVSRDGGESFQSTGVHGAGWRAFAFSPRSEVFLDRFTSHGGGTTWVRNTIPDTVVFRMLVITGNGSVVGASRYGTWVSEEGGRSWTGACWHSGYKVKLDH
jgi:hypothetical protein